MFVSKSRYNERTQEAAMSALSAISWRSKYNELLDKWNSLVREINAGEWVRPFNIGKATFTAQEIETLINLCHPDKHSGSERANNMTARLLKLRKSK